MNDDNGRTGQILRALLVEARCSGAELARLVNRIGAENGLTLRYGRASVAQWLTGTHPRAPGPELVAEALSRRLGRRVTSADLGYRVAGDGNMDSRPNSPVDELAVLDEALGAEHFVYRISEVGTPASRAVTGVSPTDQSPVRVGPGEVDAARTMLRLFSAVDAATGATVTRPALAHYIARTVSAWLRAPAADQVHRELLSVASRMAYLCGFLCVDDENDGAAQRYYRVALRLSMQADDRTGQAIVLRGMSYQAHALGHHSQALELAESASSTGAGAAPSTRAFLLGQLALAYASMDDHHHTVVYLAKAEQELHRSTDHEAVLGVHHKGSLEYQSAASRALLGDSPGAIAALHRSLRHRPPTERRSRALTLASLARLQLQQGELEEAIATWHRFLDDYPGVDSARVRSALVDLRALLRPHVNHRTVPELLQRASILLQTQ